MANVVLKDDYDPRWNWVIFTAFLVYVLVAVGVVLWIGYQLFEANPSWIELFLQRVVWRTLW